MLQSRVASNAVVNRSLVYQSPVTKVAQFGNVTTQTLKWGERLDKKVNQGSWNLFQKIKNSVLAKDIKIANLNPLDLASRFTTALALYVPQQITAWRTKVRQWETASRNVFAWAGSLALTMWVKGDHGLNARISKWYMGDEKQGFKSQYMHRAAGINSPSGKGIHWAKLDLNHFDKLEGLRSKITSGFGEDLKKYAEGVLSADQQNALEARLRKMFKLKAHEYADLAKDKALSGEHTAIKFAQQLDRKIPQFVKRFNWSRAMQVAMQTLLFTVVIGQGVMLLVWATFARLDKEYVPAKNPLKNLWSRKKTTPKLTAVQRFQTLPSRLVQAQNVMSSMGVNKAGVNKAAYDQGASL